MTLPASTAFARRPHESLDDDDAADAPSFARDKPIRFHHCDPAGIVFYPNWFVLFHELVEDWFDEALSLDYAGRLRDEGVGMPMLRLQTSFVGPARHGDLVRFALTVRRLGDSSLTFGLRADRGDVRCVRAVQTVVNARLEPLRSVPFDDDVRRRIAQWMRTGQPVAAAASDDVPAPPADARAPAGPPAPASTSSGTTLR